MAIYCTSFSSDVYGLIPSDVLNNHLNDEQMDFLNQINMTDYSMRNYSGVKSDLEETAKKLNKLNIPEFIDKHELLENFYIDFEDNSKLTLVCVDGLWECIEF